MTVFGVFGVLAVCCACCVWFCELASLAVVVGSG